MEPTAAHRDIARALWLAWFDAGDVKIGPRRDVELWVGEWEPIAQALADEFARGAASALEKLELHQITDAACKRATADGLEITIRVKPMRKRKP